MKKTPYSPFSTPLSGSAKETQMRFKNILKWKKHRPPMIALVLVIGISLMCCSMVACQPGEEETPPTMPEAPDPTLETSEMITQGTLPNATYPTQQIPTLPQNAGTTKSTIPATEVTIPATEATVPATQAVPNETNAKLNLPVIVLEEVAKKLKKAPDQVTEEDLLQITDLFFQNVDLPDISFLSYFPNLQKLLIIGTGVTDITPVAKLSHLEDLTMNLNQITDISPVEKLSNLKKLSLSGNRISDLSPIADLTKLTELRLEDNQISNLSPLENLKNLQILWIDDNKITDVTSLSGLTNLTELWIYANGITDPSPLASLVNMTDLMIGLNPIPEESRSVLDHLTGVHWDETGYW